MSVGPTPPTMGSSRKPARVGHPVRIVSGWALLGEIRLTFTAAT